MSSQGQHITVGELHSVISAGLGYEIRALELLNDMAVASALFDLEISKDEQEKTVTKWREKVTSTQTKSERRRVTDIGSGSSEVLWWALL